MIKVLVHGKNIPPNAIVAGEDKRRPLFIARTFWEVRACVISLSFLLTLSRNIRVVSVSNHTVVVVMKLYSASHKLLDIGQAGQHFERGASFAYLGREIHVSPSTVTLWTGC